MFDAESRIGKGINEIEQNGEMKLGLKLISDLSENITYVHSLETNNVIMRFPIKYSIDAYDEGEEFKE